MVKSNCVQFIQNLSNIFIKQKHICIFNSFIKKSTIDLNEYQTKISNYHND